MSIFKSAQFQLARVSDSRSSPRSVRCSRVTSPTRFSRAAARRSPPVSISSRRSIILLAAQFHTANAAVVFLVLISFTANSTHSILGTAAAMDIGGAKMSGFASGVIDSFQYFGGSLAGYFLGALLEEAGTTTSTSWLRSASSAAC